MAEYRSGGSGLDGGTNAPARPISRGSGRARRQARPCSAGGGGGDAAELLLVVGPNGSATAPVARPGTGGCGGAAAHPAAAANWAPAAPAAAAVFSARPG